MFRIKSLPNTLTLSRILGVGLIFWLTPYSNSLTQLWVVTIYTIICLTDFFDGWIARRFNSVSDFGKVMDPLADKILVLVFLPLLTMKAITAFPVFVILAREFSIMGLRVFAAKNRIIIAANFSGKLKTAITLPVCGILFARMPIADSIPIPAYFAPLNTLKHWVHSWPSWIFETLIWVMVFLTITSFLDYIIRFFWAKILRKAKGDVAKAKKNLLKYIPNTVSFFNFLCGVLSIILALRGNVILPVGLILGGAILDAIDGQLARKFGTHSKLGEKFDEKADFTTFGLAPAVLIYKHISMTLPEYAHLVGAFFGILFYAAVHYRLIRYSKSGHSNFFEGLPSPAGSSMIVIFLISPVLSHLIYFIPIAMIASLLMASKLPYPHNRISHHKYIYKHLRKPTFIFFILTILLSVGVPFPNSIYIPEILACLTGMYLLAPIIPTKKEFK